MATYYYYNTTPGVLTLNNPNFYYNDLAHTSPANIVPCSNDTVWILSNVNDTTDSYDNTESLTFNNLYVSGVSFFGDSYCTVNIVSSAKFLLSSTNGFIINTNPQSTIYFYNSSVNNGTIYSNLSTTIYFYDNCVNNGINYISPTYFYDNSINRGIIYSSSIYFYNNSKNYSATTYTTTTAYFTNNSVNYGVLSGTVFFNEKSYNGSGGTYVNATYNSVKLKGINGSTFLIF